MSKVNNNQIELYNQIMKVKKCSDALRDIYESVPEDERYISALRIIGEKLDIEVGVLLPLALKDN